MDGVREISDPSPRQKADAERYTYDRSGLGTVSFEECPCCGSVRWATSSKEPTEKLIIRVYEGGDIDRCDACQFVSQRTPEIFQWVTNVVLYQINKAVPDRKP